MFWVGPRQTTSSPLDAHAKPYDMAGGVEQEQYCSESLPAVTVQRRNVVSPTRGLRAMHGEGIIAYPLTVNGGTIHVTPG
ncbi:hypothetical protein N7470_009495 [Penicillium chermesinum]|nr:hypothetical protein N7470_009495 [Penicillium chermesinum]